MQLNGKLTYLASFGAGDGWVPESRLLFGAFGNLYGTTPTGDIGYQGGSLYAVVPGGR